MGMTALILSADQRRDLRAQAHHLNATVHIGSEGLTAAVSKEIDAALAAHGLLKVRAMSDDRVQRQEWLNQLADALNAAPVQLIGKLLVLWRPLPPKTKPARDDRQPGPRHVKVVSFSKSGNHRATVKTVKVLGNQRITAAGLVKRKKSRSVSVKKKSST